jgi:hypothetical protein
MDPNEALAEFLRARREADASIERGHTEAERFHLAVAVEAADNLFTWLSNGGFQPDWQIVAAETIG